MWIHLLMFWDIWGFLGVWKKIWVCCSPHSGLWGWPWKPWGWAGQGCRWRGNSLSTPRPTTCEHTPSTAPSLQMLIAARKRFALLSSNSRCFPKNRGKRLAVLFQAPPDREKIWVRLMDSHAFVTAMRSRVNVCFVKTLYLITRTNFLIFHLPFTYLMGYFQEFLK